MHLLTTMGYMDYEIAGDFPSEQKATKKVTRTAKISDPAHSWIEKKRHEWGTTQADVIARLIEFFESNQTTKLEKSEDQEMGAVADLQNQVNEMATQIAALTQAVSGLISQDATQPITRPQSPTPKPVAKQPANNWALATAADLWGENWDKPSRAAGAAEERIDRAIRAIFAHNDQLLGYPAKDKWAIGNRVLRDLTGANGQMIAARLQLWSGVINEHHAKHGIESDYHNRTHHRGVDACEVMRPVIQSIDP
jgi:hypothetical protein